MTDAHGLSEKLDQLKAERDESKSALAAAKELAKLRAQVANSRKFALGRLLGRYKGVLADKGKTPQEKLANLKKAARDGGLL